MGMMAVSYSSDQIIPELRLTMSDPQRLELGAWTADRMSGRLDGPGQQRSLEPKVMDLLFVLAMEPGRVLTRAELLAHLWPHVVVGDDVIARAVFKLRAALRDGPDQVCTVETIPKRGYRLVFAAEAKPQSLLSQPGPLRSRLTAALCSMAVVGLAILIWQPGLSQVRRTEPIVERAKDSYFQYSKAENEAAMTLFQRALTHNPRNAEALAGLSSAIVQRVVRWPNGQELVVSGSRLQHALLAGRHREPSARRQLTNALALAEAAERLQPESPEIIRARGLALAALDRRAEAEAAYRQALALDEHAWGVMINLADLLDYRREPVQAAELMARAYDSMHASYASEPARIRPWFAAVGFDVARRRLALGDMEDAVSWYSRTLRDHPQAAEEGEKLRSILAR